MYRREALGCALAVGTAGLLPACSRSDDGAQRSATDIAELEATRIAGIIRPTTSAGVVAALKAWQGAICIAGARFSMGGQTREPDALQFDLAGMNGLVRLDPVARVTRVQAGMRWRELQALLDPHDLAVKVMQSYSNFSVGGSVSVNCHGRYIGQGAIAGTVRATQLATADGRLVELSRDREPALFGAVLGGYGGLGVITEVELDLAENTRIGRHVEAMPLAAYADWFQANVLDMETAAVGMVAYSNGVPYIAFRSLSDLAGGGDGENEMGTFMGIAADNSAKVLLAFLAAWQ